MKDEHREKLDRRLTPIHLYKFTPKTNCGECGFAACLAFATQVIVGQGDLDSCPYLDKGAMEPFRSHLADQHRSGIGLKREGFEKALQFLRQEVLKWDFCTIAHSLGAEILEVDGDSVLRFPYFGEEVSVTHHDVSLTSGKNLDPYEKILIFNYVIGGATEPSGVWVGMETLPNSVSKIKSLKAHCEERTARSSAGKVHRLSQIMGRLGHKVTAVGEHVDFAVDFQILPRLTVRVLWWDEDDSEGFEAKTKFLFDSRVLKVVDLESLLFACEQLTDRLLEATGR